MESNAKVSERAVLVGVQLPGVSAAEVHASLDELERLAKTLGLNIVHRLTQPRPNVTSAIVLGAGKLKELAHLTGGSGEVASGAARRRKGSRPGDDAEEPEGDEQEEDDTDEDEDDADDAPEASSALPPEQRAGIVLFDHDLSPSQLRNLESATSAQVLDRTSVILTIFQRHARTREARLQVEIARLTYLAPRLRATGGGSDRQRGGIGGKGAGETAVELDRRRARDRIAELKQELIGVQQEAELRRARRLERDGVALVGYTNAGKSSLMRALTGSEVLVKDQVFATLDTTVRQLQPKTKPPVHVSDTVGFIKKLPHDLVASFRSTLAEARDAALLLYVVDASDPSWRSQHEVTCTVLKELGAGDVPSLLVLNKADRLDDEAIAALREEFPSALVVSAHRPGDVTRIHEAIVAWFERDMVEAEIFVPYAKPKLVHQIHEGCRVLEETHHDTGTTLRVRAMADLVATLRAAAR